MHAGGRREAGGALELSGHPRVHAAAGFLFDTPVCLVDEFREGNVCRGPGSSRATGSVGRGCQGKRLPRYPADSAAYQADVINELETDQVRGAVTAEQDVAVNAVIRGIAAADWQEPVPGCGCQLAEAVYTMTHTQTAFRLIIKRKERRQPDLFEAATVPDAYHVVASNWPEEEKTASEVRIWHNQRGQAENFKKELKTGWGMEQRPCGDS